MAAQMSAAHPTGVVEVSERALDVLTASSCEPLAAGATDTTAIVIDRALRLWPLRPVPPAALGFRDVRAHRDGFEIDQRLVL
jgi:hypothetical protein